MDIDVYQKTVWRMANLSVRRNCGFFAGNVFVYSVIEFGEQR